MTAVLLAAGLLGGRALRDRLRVFTTSRAARWAIALLNLGVVVTLLLAGFNPVLYHQEPVSGSHLALVVDVSSSVQRAADDWIEIRTPLQQRLQRFIGQIEGDTAEQSTCSIVTCARGSRSVVADADLEELPIRCSRLTDGSFPPIDASDIEAGLEAAAELIESAGNRGSVLLVSDGHQTRGDALAAAERLARRGIAVHVMPIAGRSPEIGIYSADLPPNIEAGATTHARVFLMNRSATGIEIDLRPDLPGAGEESSRLNLPSGAHWVKLRQPVTFEDAGIHSLDLELRAAGEVKLRRRFFTMVTAPPRVLAIGDGRWTRGLPPGKFEVTVMAAEEIPDNLDPSRYDLVVVNGVDSARLPHQLPDRLADAMEERGTGLLLVNGRHVGTPEDPTMLMSYDETMLEPLSPVITSPRPLLPPSRQIVILIDASGSMSGWPMAMQKKIAAYIISQMRETDYLDLIAFTSSSHHLIKNQLATDEVKRRALRALGTVSASGGTDPSAALRLIANRRFQECGLFFLSDGHFAHLALRPDCQATVFAIGHSESSIPEVLIELAEPFPVDPSFNPASVKISYLDPEKRKNHFEVGRYRPLDGIDALQGGWTMLPDPARYLHGNAVTHAREDAELAAIRPRFTDPILAFRDGRAGTMAVFTTEIPDAYIEQGEETVTRWLERLLSYSARDRYGIAIQDRGANLELRVSLLAQRGVAPRVHRLSALLEVVDGGSSSVTLRPDPELTGVFIGVIPWPEVRPGAAAALVLRESGPDALERPQRIPFTLPAVVAESGFQQRSGEAWSHGLNQELLHRIADAGGGRYDPGPDDLLLHGGGPGAPAVELRSVLLVSAALLFLAQITVRRLAV
jgi:Mg-chelatase subunit ChlD